MEAEATPGGGIAIAGELLNRRHPSKQAEAAKIRCNLSMTMPIWASAHGLWAFASSTVEYLNYKVIPMICQYIF